MTHNTDSRLEATVQTANTTTESWSSHQPDWLARRYCDRSRCQVGQVCARAGASGQGPGASVAEAGSRWCSSPSVRCGRVRMAQP